MFLLLLWMQLYASWRDYTKNEPYYGRDPKRFKYLYFYPKWAARKAAEFAIGMSREDRFFTLAKLLGIVLLLYAILGYVMGTIFAPEKDFWPRLGVGLFAWVCIESVVAIGTFILSTVMSTCRTMATAHGVHKRANAAPEAQPAIPSNEDADDVALIAKLDEANGSSPPTDPPSQSQV